MVRRKTISVHLIKQTLPIIPDEKYEKQDDKAEEDFSLFFTRKLRLDRQQIDYIDNLELFEHLEHLQLQHNNISVIENLDFLPKLRVLVLAHNQIETVENVKHLARLRFLDLSYNKIEEFDTDDLPSSLIALNLKGNPCVPEIDTEDHDMYCQVLQEHLSHLQYLDDVNLESNMEFDIERESSDKGEGEGEGEEEEEEEVPLTARARQRRAPDVLGGGFFGAAARRPSSPDARAEEMAANVRTRLKDTVNSAKLRSQQRRVQMTEEHEVVVGQIQLSHPDVAQRPHTAAAPARATSSTRPGPLGPHRLPPATDELMRPATSYV